MLHVYDTIRFYLFSTFFRFSIVLLIDRNAMTRQNFQILFPNTRRELGTFCPMVDDRIIYMPNIFMWLFVLMQTPVAFSSGCTGTESQKRRDSNSEFSSRKCSAAEKRMRGIEIEYSIYLLTVQGSTSNAVRKPNYMILISYSL